MYRRIADQPPPPSATATADPATTGGGRYTTLRMEAALAGVADPAGVGRAVLLVLEKWVRSLRGTLLVPAILWLALRRWGPRLQARQRPGRAWPAVPAANPEGLRLLFALEGLHLLIVIALVLRFDYWELLSVRHTLILAALTMPLAAAGCLAIIQALPQRGRTFGAVLLMGALIAPTLPWMLERRFADDRYLREAAEWLRKQPGSRRILTTRHRVAFYADGQHVWSPLDANVETILATARDERPDYLVFDERRLVRERPTFFSDLQSLVQPGEELELVHDQPQAAPATADHALVYRYRRLP